MTAAREVLPWEHFGAAADELAAGVTADGFTPDLILAVAREGLFVAGALGYALGAIPDYRSVDGNHSVHILERTDGEVTHFVTLTFWRDIDCIRAFAGEDHEVAKYYPEDKDFLLDFEPRVLHYEVVGHS